MSRCKTKSKTRKEEVVGNLPQYTEKTSDYWKIMEFFVESISILQTFVIALGAGLAVWGVINLLEGYGNDSATLISM